MILIGGFKKIGKALRDYSILYCKQAAREAVQNEIQNSLRNHGYTIHHSRCNSNTEKSKIENLRSLENKPFTYEQLYELHGKIVWIECLEDRTHSECRIIDAQNARAINVNDNSGDWYNFKDYAEDWLAYERPVI